MTSIRRRLASMKRRVASSAGVATLVSIGLAVATLAALGALLPGQAGAGRGPVMIAVGVFALAMFAWSRLRSRNDANL